jgi:hypothetical protein
LMRDRKARGEEVGATAKTAKVADNSPTMTVESILKAFTPVESLIDAINALPAGEFRRDEDMRILAGMSTAKWSQAKRSKRAESCRVRLPDGSCVWGRDDDAAVLKRRLLEVRA